MGGRHRGVTRLLPAQHRARPSVRESATEWPQRAAAAPAPGAVKGVFVQVRRDVFEGTRREATHLGPFRKVENRLPEERFDETPARPLCPVSGSIGRHRRDAVIGPDPVAKRE